MHFCHEELFALMMGFSLLSPMALWLKNWWHKRHTCHHDDEKAREAQRRSFVYGNVAIDNPNVTREMVDQAAKELKA